MTWKEIKEHGSKHYKLGDIEAIDLYKAEGTLHNWVICEARHHLGRNLKELNTLGTDKCIEDMVKVIHYANIIICLSEEYKTRGFKPAEVISTDDCMGPGRVYRG